MNYMNYYDAISFDALYEAAQKCDNNVIWKDSVAHFMLNCAEECMKLEKQLKNGQYVPRPPKKFKITHPKEREIISISFRDRVYQRSLNDNILYPIMTNSFIYDNWACQKNKGTLKAKQRFEELLHRYYRKNGENGWVAQFDIHSYYPSMNHQIVENIFNGRLEDKAFQAVCNILRNQYEGEVGYNAGSQMVQIVGISLLDKLDHFIKERLHIKTYIRYMDDFILIHPDKKYLLYCSEAIKVELSKLKLQLNEKKTKIFQLKSGVSFLGFDFNLTKTGKVLKHIKPNNVKNEKIKLRRLVFKSRRGEIKKDAVDQSYQCWRQHASYGNNYKLLLKMDEYYRNLWVIDYVYNKSENKRTERD